MQLSTSPFPLRLCLRRLRHPSLRPASLSPPVVAPQAAPLPSPSYSDCSTPSSSTSGASPLNSPTGQNSVQHIQSQFIKEGLKMKVRQKLKSEPEEGGAFEPNLSIKRELEDLTPEDEDRRRRRRERNKIAATKCRNKKKEKTTILVAESEIVEVQNASLKAEVARLDAEKRRLTTILAQHAPNCAKKSDDCARARRKSLLLQRQARRSSTTCPTPSADQQRLEVRTAEALLVPARNSTATEATVQTELAKGATTRRRTRWRTTLVTSPSSPKPKITISTAVERCTTCII